MSLNPSYLPSLSFILTSKSFLLSCTLIVMQGRPSCHPSNGPATSTGSLVGDHCLQSPCNLFQCPRNPSCKSGFINQSPVSCRLDNFHWVGLLEIRELHPLWSPLNQLNEERPSLGSLLLMACPIGAFESPLKLGKVPSLLGTAEPSDLWSTTSSSVDW